MVSAAPALTSKKMAKDRPKETSIIKLAKKPAACLGIDFQPRPLIKKPIKGNKGIKYANCIILCFKSKFQEGALCAKNLFVL